MSWRAVSICCCNSTSRSFARSTAMSRASISFARASSSLLLAAAWAPTLQRNSTVAATAAARIVVVEPSEAFGNDLRLAGRESVPDAHRVRGHEPSHAVPDERGLDAPLVV